MAPRARPGLEPLLGVEGTARLHEVLTEATLAWAREFCGERVAVMREGEDLGAAVEDAFARFGGPLLVVGTAMPRLGRVHAEAALADIAGGADASFGPALDGGFYLLALSHSRPELLALVSADEGGPGVLARALEKARELGLDVGLLRTERVLDTAADAAALLADPLTPVAVRAALSVT